MLHPRVVGDRSNAASSIHSYYTFKGIKAYLAFIFQKDFSFFFSQCKHIKNRQSTEKTTTRCTNVRNVSGTSQLNTSLPPTPIPSDASPLKQNIVTQTYNHSVFLSFCNQQNSDILKIPALRLPS